MIRLTWRLARPNLLSSAVLVALVAVFAVLTERSMSAYLEHSGINTCLAAHGDCRDLITRFNTKFDIVTSTYAWINLVPLFIGVFWGGPLVAREIELGTHRLVWTQSVSRGRWLLTKLGGYMLAVAAVAAAVTVIMTWWFGPIEKIRNEGENTFGRLSTDVFDFRGIVPVAYALFAFALGAAAGAVLKRTTAAMVVTLVVYLPARIIMQGLRVHFMAPRTLTYGFGTESPRVYKGDWILSHDIVDPSGQVITKLMLPEPCRAEATRETANACLNAQGYRFQDIYHPISRFWPFQFIEAGIFIGAAAVLLALAVWWITRRTA